MDLLSNMASKQAYSKASYEFDSIRERVYNYIISHQGCTRKEIMSALNVSNKNEGRVSELLQHGYLYQKLNDDGVNELFVVDKNKKYDKNDFKNGSNKNVDPAVKYGARFGINLFQICMNNFLTAEEKNVYYKQLMNAFKNDMAGNTSLNNFKLTMNTINQISDQIAKKLKEENTTDLKEKAVYILKSNPETFLAAMDLVDIVDLEKMGMDVKDMLEGWIEQYPEHKHLIGVKND